MDPNRGHISNMPAGPDSGKKRSPGPVILFFLVFAAVTVLAWCLPLRPEVSLKEKRNLEKFPEFSVSALADGSYFRQIGLWWSDTFPGRDVWIGADQSIKRLHGVSDVVIYGQIDAGDEIPTAAPAATPAPTAAPSAEPQNAAAEATAEPTEEPEEEIVWGGKVIEEEELLAANRATIQIGDSVFEYTGFSQFHSDEYTASMNKAAALLEGRSRVFSVVVPSAATILIPWDYREYMKCAAEEDVFEYLKSRYDPAVYAVDTLTELLRHNGEYVYFHADHHWTALGAWYGYAAWAKAAGVEPVGLENYTEVVQEPFLGSLYYQANQSGRLQVDSVHAYVPPGDVHLYIVYDDRDTPAYRGEEQDLIVDIYGTDKYMCFLTGDLPLCTFVNNDLDDDSACLIVKDSNGNPFCYYFTQHYKYVYVIDYRKYHHYKLSEFVDTYGVDDVIFCFSAAQAQGRGGNQLLKALIQ